jgi:hypothetical protein
MALNPGRKLVLSLMGCGNGAHVIGALAGAHPDYEVRMLTRRPEVFASKQITVQRPGIMGGEDVVGKLDVVGSDPDEVLPGSDVILWCGPVFATPIAMKQIAPTVRAMRAAEGRAAYVGTIFAQGCSHLLARSVLGEETPFFALQNIPWLCTTIEQGKVARIVGNKHHIRVATSENASFTWTKKFLEPCINSTTGFKGAELQNMADFAAIVLNPANQIIHPARMWGRFSDWDGVTPFEAGTLGSLYGDFCDKSAEALVGLDAELQAIKGELEVAVPSLDLAPVIPLAERIVQQYGDQVADKSSMRSIMATNQAYSMAQFPMVPSACGGGVVPNHEHRVVQDDIPHGLVPLRDIAAQLGLKTPWMDEMITWHQQLMGKEYLVDGELTGKDMDECTSPTVLGGTDLAHVGFTDPPATPC